MEDYLHVTNVDVGPKIFNLMIMQLCHSQLWWNNSTGILQIVFYLILKHILWG